MAALLAHGAASLESVISMMSGGGHASDEAWTKATRTARELDRILDGVAPVREAVVRAASELRLSTRQVYNYLARYRESAGYPPCYRERVEQGNQGSAPRSRASLR